MLKKRFPEKMDHGWTRSIALYMRCAGYGAAASGLYIQPVPTDRTTPSGQPADTGYGLVCL